MTKNVSVKNLKIQVEEMKMFRQGRNLILFYDGNGIYM